MRIAISSAHRICAWQATGDDVRAAAAQRWLERELAMRMDPPVRSEPAAIPFATPSRRVGDPLVVPSMHTTGLGSLRGPISPGHAASFG